MELRTHPSLEISPDLLEAIRTFPVKRQVQHCGDRFTVSPFDLYADCPRCGTRIKLRSFSACAEIEDVFDAVFQWLNQAGAREAARRRQQAIAEDTES